MHWIERPPEPSELQSIRARQTGGWVRYYPDRKSPRPTDRQWSRFVDDLNAAFGDICAYCEETCKPEVDHFRPTSRYPWLVYRWSNWLFSCSPCNNTKRARWPSTGYVDPCANPLQGTPERYFRFDTDKSEIRPRKDLDSESCRKAKRTIDDLGLNARHHLIKRERLVVILSTLFASQADLAHPKIRASIDFFTSRSEPLSSFARAWLSERDCYSG